jgi:hypothetical protein
MVLAVGIYLAVQIYFNHVSITDQFDPELQDKRIQESVRKVIYDEAKNITVARTRLAAEETADFVSRFMATTPAFENAFKLLSHSLAAVDSELDGYYAEFGVYKGKTINYIASQIDATIHGFDSFEGLPEDWRTKFKKGEFKMEGLPEVADNVELYKGWFDASVPKWATEHPGPMKFIHFDADLYSSTRTVLEILVDRIVPGTIIQFDEFFNYPGWTQGEFKAFMEFVEKNDVVYEYIGYVTGELAEQVAVRILEINN